MQIPAGQTSFIDDMIINKKATANAASKFLNKGLEKYLRRAGWNRSKLAIIDESHISSPKMDASGVSSRGGINNMEENMINIIEAKRV